MLVVMPVMASSNGARPALDVAPRMARARRIALLLTTPKRSAKRFESGVPPPERPKPPPSKPSSQSAVRAPTSLGPAGRTTRAAQPTLRVLSERHKRHAPRIGEHVRWPPPHLSVPRRSCRRIHILVNLRSVCDNLPDLFRLRSRLTPNTVVVFFAIKSQQ